MINFKSFVTESKERKSLFDKNIPVIIYYKSDWEYEIWKPQFKKFGWAIGVLEHKTIVWDGEAIVKLDNDEIAFVEAHEYSHFKLGPKASEAECDWLAIANLWKKGLKGAAKIGVDRFVERHGAEFDTEDLPGYDEWAKKSKRLGEAFINECREKDIDILSALKYPEKYGMSLSKSILTSAWEEYTELLINN